MGIFFGRYFIRLDLACPFQQYTGHETILRRPGLFATALGLR